MNQVRFRELAVGDKASLQSLFSQLIANFNGILEIENLISDQRCNCIVIDDGNSAVGFGSLVTYMVPSKGEVGRIEDIIIDEKYRGKGLGRKLLEKLISIADEKKLSHIYLTCRPERVAARKLYESLGFKKGDTNMFSLDLR